MVEKKFVKKRCEVQVAQKLTEGRPSKVIFLFAMPILLSTIFQQLYTIADSVIAGKFAGESALAAIGASYPVAMIFMAIAFGSNAGCSIIISQLFGAGRVREMKTAVSTSMITLAALSTVLSVGALIFAPQIMTAMNTPTNISAEATEYFRIYIGGFLFLSLYNIANGAFTALGDSKTPLWFLIASSVANVALDYIFVAEYGWGVAGAAWATFITQGLACIFAVLTLIIRLGKMKSEKYEIFSFTMLRNLTRVSSQTITQQSFVSVGNMLVQWLINGYGSAVIAGFSAVVKLNTFAITSIYTMSRAMSAFTAQNVGAGNYDRVKKGFRAAILVSSAVAGLFTVAYMLFGDFFISMFLETGSSSEALKIGTECIKIISSFYVVVSVKMVSDAVTSGAGAMKLFAIATFTDLLLRVALSYALAPFFDMMGVASSWIIGWAVAAIMSYCFYRFGNWKGKKLA